MQDTSESSYLNAYQPGLGPTGFEPEGFEAASFASQHEPTYELPKYAEPGAEGYEQAYDAAADAVDGIPGAPAPSPETALTAVFRLLFPTIPPGLAAVGAKWLSDFAFSGDQVAAAVDAHAKREVVSDVFDAVDVILCAEQAQLSTCPVLRQRVESGSVSTLKAVVGALNERFTGPMTSEQILRLIDQAVPADALSPKHVPQVKNTVALHEEASAYLHQGIATMAAGQLDDARASFLVVSGLGDTEAAGTALYFLGALAARRGDLAQARVWYYRATTGPDPHWARAAIEELRRLG